MRERGTLVGMGFLVATCAPTWMPSKDAFSPAVAVVGIFFIAALKVRFATPSGA